MLSDCEPEASFKVTVFLPMGVSRRQVECLDWAQQGKSSSDIAVILGVSKRTVDAHLYKLCRNLGVKSRLQAMTRARELGLLKEPVHLSDLAKPARAANRGRGD